MTRVSGLACASTVRILAVFLGVGTAATAQPPAPPRIEKIVLAKDVYLFRMPLDAFAQGPGNSVVIINERDVTIFDSNMRPSSAQALIAEVRALTSNPVRVVINSHWHQDHWTGNAVYAAAYPGVQIIATTETRDVMKAMAPTFAARGFRPTLTAMQATLDSAIRAGKGADGTPFTADDRRQSEARIESYRRFVAEADTVTRLLPTIGYRDSLVLWSGSREFRLASLDGDAVASTVLYLPQERVLLTGDLLVYPVQWATNSYRIRPWLSALEALGRLDVAVIVPGHGPPFRDRSYLLLVTELFESITTQVDAALARGLTTVDEVQAVVNLDALRARFTGGDPALERRFRERSAQIVAKAFLEARDGIGP